MTLIEALKIASALSISTRTIDGLMAAIEKMGAQIGICNETGDWVVLRDNIELARVA